MLGNPFEAPKAGLVDSASSASLKAAIYSPGQVTAGAIFGGPLVAIYFLYRTFRGMKQDAYASRTLIGGLIFAITLPALLPFLPARFPNTAIPLAYTLIAKGIANKFQIKKPGILASEEYELVPNGRVALEILVGGLIYAVVLFAEVLLVLGLRGGL